MSAVCILTPVVIAAWPAFSAAVVAAAGSLGYVTADHSARALREEESPAVSSGRVALEIPQSEIITDKLARAQHVTVTKDGITVTFSRDARGKAAVCVTGAGYEDATLRAHGEELCQRVVQQYVYQRLKEEFHARQFTIVEEETDEGHAIRLKVRHWEN